ncbi:MAG: glycosyltransferase family 4 protein [Methylocella sp.]
MLHETDGKDSQQDMRVTPVRILVPRLVDATQTNPQSLNAKALLSRFSDPSCQWMAVHYGEPLADIANNRRVTLTRLWRGRLWPWHLMILYLRGVDAIFYPGIEWFDDYALQLRRRFLRRAPLIAILEGFAGDAQREATLSKWAGHPVFCDHVEAKVVERIDRMLHQADHIIAISPFVAKICSQLYGDKFSALPLGIETKLIAAALPASRIDTAPHVRTVICVGSVDDRKRPEMFLKLAEQFRTVRFRWIGEGRRREALIMEANRRGLHNLSFPGGLPHEGVTKELKAADIFVLPSRSEGVPKVTQEAAACGLPIIAFGYYEPPTVIDGENGYRVWSDDEFALRLSQLIDDGDRRQAMGERSSELAKTWDWDVLAKQWEEEILRFIGRSRGQ